MPHDITYAPPEDPEQRSQLEQDALEALSRARVQLLFVAPFFGELTTYLELVPIWPENWWSPDFPPTAATDGKSLFFNPTYVLYLTHDELCFILCHEVLHAALGHIPRLADHDHFAWNVATDLVINATIIEYCSNQANVLPWTMPAGGLNDPKYLGKSADWVYAKVFKPKANSPKQKGNKKPKHSKTGEEKPPQPQGEKNDSPSTGQADPDKRGTEQEQKREDTAQQDHPESFDPGKFKEGLEAGRVQTQMKPSSGNAEGHGDHEKREAEAWAQRVKTAWEKQKSRYGSSSSNLDREIELMLKPRVDWRVLLQRFVSCAAKDGYSWAQPNRRLVHRGVYLPSLHSWSLGEVVVIIDDSGSCYEAVPRFLSEARAIFESYPNTLVHLVACDVDPRHIRDWKPGDGSWDFEAKLVVRGGGGTSFVKPFSMIRNNNWRPNLVIYLTDLDGRLPGRELDPGCPVLWVVNNDRHEQSELEIGELCVLGDKLLS